MTRQSSKIPIPTLDHEREIKNSGYRVIAGVDEAGRGSLFGPVCVGMVVLPLDDMDALALALAEVRDSKLIAREKVYQLAADVKATALAWAVGQGSAQQVDQYGIVAATRLAAEQALAAILQDGLAPDYLLTDSRMPTPTGFPLENQRALVKGDRTCLSIASAAILAKECHDRVVRELAQHYDDGYQLNNNVGYGTAAHRHALQLLGPTPDHRYSFRPIAQPRLLDVLDDRYGDSNSSVTPTGQ
ncbi:MAG: ribonuclease HII [Chloroflexi bacterium]|nr:ribonuclease HII [Chloroflexota bacterium]